MIPENLQSKTTTEEGETTAIKSRYQRRTNNTTSNFYSALLPSVYMARQELERTLINDILNPYLTPLSDKTVLEVGCGNGINLMDFIKLGFLPENLTGNELLEERVAAAKHKLPDKVNIISGNALELTGMENTFDIVYQSTVFTSLLDLEFQKKLANRMWEWVKPGGAVLWYDFIYNNPNNPDVQGVSLKRVKELFPDAIITYKKVTLAPPISRRVTKIHPSLYTVFNLFPFLRTHILCWISKPE